MKLKMKMQCLNFKNNYQIISPLINTESGKDVKSIPSHHPSNLNPKKVKVSPISLAYIPFTPHLLNHVIHTLPV